MTADQEFGSLENENFDERNNEIVGKQVEKAEYYNHALKKRELTIQEKVAKELEYVTQAMGLDPF